MNKHCGMGITETMVGQNKETSGEGTVKSPDTVMDMNDFQKCLDSCRFGKYQYRLIFVIFFQAVSSAITITNFAYVLPNAECDLHMTIYQKGILNAVPYIGMLCSGFFAGFVTDTFGRKTMLLYGLFGIFTSICVQGTSQTFGVLAAAKSVEGFLFNGAYSACAAFLSEFATSKTRDRMMLTFSSFISVGQVILALMAWAILPRKWDIKLFEGALSLHSWNFFLYAGGIFSLTAGILYSQFPESPKFHFAHGRYDEAFATLREIYSVNTGKPPETFPHQAPSRSACENEKENKSVIETIQESVKSLKPMVKRPLLSYILILVSIQGILMFGYNTMRLWYPQISTIVETYKLVGNDSNTLCVMLDTYMVTAKNVTSTTLVETQECIPNKSGTETYINAVIMGISCCIPYIVSGLIINLVGKRVLVVSFLTICTGTCAGLYWATNSIQVAALFSIFVALAQTTLSILLTITLEVFPTVAKSLAVSMTYTTGRLTSLIGNIVFPMMLAQDCIVPFITISSVVGFGAFLALFLPVVKK